MKTTITLFLTIILLSCNQRIDKDTQRYKRPQESEKTKTTTDKKEKFKTLVSDQINQTLVETNKKLTPSDVMKLYYPHELKTDEGNETIEICEKRGKNDHIIVTLIHDNLLDDSQKAVKYVMELKKTNDKWTVVSVKMNWKCWPDRGHTDWGTDYCI
ncbi:MAG TPA: hypothetical protein VK021_02360 [Flavobacteriaceae bacterium]|nr:hypothetical protein [Flavobacteriaceae bacterium]